MKLVGKFRGIPVYSSPDCPPDAVYLLNDSALERVFPLKKDGKPDMRYSINKLERAFMQAGLLNPLNN